MEQWSNGAIEQWSDGFLDRFYQVTPGTPRYSTR